MPGASPARGASPAGAQSLPGAHSLPPCPGLSPCPEAFPASLLRVSPCLGSFPAQAAASGSSFLFRPVRRNNFLKKKFGLFHTPLPRPP